MLFVVQKLGYSRKCVNTDKIFLESYMKHTIDMIMITLDIDHLD